MGERADCGKMAAMCGRSTPLAGNADETPSVYIYIYGSRPWSTGGGGRVAGRVVLPWWSNSVFLKGGSFAVPLPSTTGSLSA